MLLIAQIKAIVPSQRLIATSMLALQLLLRKLAQPLNLLLLRLIKVANRVVSAQATTE